MSKKTHRTLGFYGFTRSVEHRGIKTNVEILVTVELPPPAICVTCDKGFKNTQGLDVHKLICKEKSNDMVFESPLLVSNSSFSTLDELENDVKNTMNYILCRVEERDANRHLKENAPKTKKTRRCKSTGIT